MRKRSWSKNEPRARWVRERISSYRARWAPGVTSPVGRGATVAGEAGASCTLVVADAVGAAPGERLVVARVAARDAQRVEVHRTLVDRDGAPIRLDPAPSDDGASGARFGDRATDDQKQEAEDKSHGDSSGAWPCCGSSGIGSLL